MKRTFLTLAVITMTLAANSFAQTTVVGGEEMFPKKNIVENAVNAVNSEDHTTLVAAVQAAGLVDALQTAGPFTVFAPVNDAFENLPEGTVATLLKPENKEMLGSILKYHVVSGNFTFDAIAKEIKKGGGKATMTTLSGGTLTASMNGAHNIVITDENGNSANISVYDVMQSNGVIHVIDSVVLPKS